MALSPMMQQYNDIKKQHPDKILFFRLGDFYEMFFDDAILASKELELTLTGRDCGLEERAPMCGVPFHAYETYLARLISKGYKVAICEQMENPSAAKGIVRRDVVRVVTPGTVIENSMLQDDKNNYIASIFLQGENVGLCFADVSTGTAHVTQLTGKDVQSQIISQLCCYSPKEILFNEQALNLKEVTNFIKFQLACGVELIDNTVFVSDNCESEMVRQFGQDYEKSTGILSDSIHKNAVVALIYYLNETQKKGVERLKNINIYTQNQYMHMSFVTRANLELCETMRGREKRGTLLWVLDKTKTSMGKRLIRTWIEQPLLSASSINSRLDAVGELLHDSIKRDDITEKLSKIYDMERLTTRAVYGSAMPSEVYALALTCTQLPELLTLIDDMQSGEIVYLKSKLDPLTDIKDMIFSMLDENAPTTLKDGGIIKFGANSEVDELKNILKNSEGFLSQLEARLKDETNIRTLKIRYNRVFGYYIEVSKSFTEQVPPNFVRKQTLANAERYITEDLKILENKILGASERLLTLEKRLFEELLKNISNHILRIQTTSSAVATLDVLCSFAGVAASNNYVCPTVVDGDEIAIEEGRHPVVEQMQSKSLFVPNDTRLDCGDNRMAIITGPNMAGKSTYMRQTALIVIMAQIGSFVPAKSCKTCIVDGVYTRVGASDDLAAGKSTFMVEMTEVAEILQNATKDSLVILDEIGRGTSTFDGMSIARAVVEYMADKGTNLGCKTLFATHYHELTELEDELDGVKNYNIAAKKRGDDITFLRRIVRGPADDSYGIEVSKLAGLPDSVIKRAREVLKVLEEGTPNVSTTTQLNFENVGKYAQKPYAQEIADKLELVNVETLTPIEAMNTLYELKSMLNELKNS